MLSGLRTGENKTNILTAQANQTHNSKQNTRHVTTILLQEQNAHMHILSWVSNLHPVDIRSRRIRYMAYPNLPYLITKAVIFATSRFNLSYYSRY